MTLCENVLNGVLVDRDRMKVCVCVQVCVDVLIDVMIELFQWSVMGPSTGCLSKFALLLGGMRRMAVEVDDK